MITIAPGPIAASGGLELVGYELTETTTTDEIDFSAWGHFARFLRATVRRIGDETTESTLDVALQIQNAAGAWVAHRPAGHLDTFAPALTPGIGPQERTWPYVTRARVVLTLTGDPVRCRVVVDSPQGWRETASAVGQ